MWCGNVITFLVWATVGCFWVSTVSSGTWPDICLNPKCVRLVDVMFVLDGSDSIDPESFIFQLDLVDDIIDRIRLDPTVGFQVGAVVFSSTVGSSSIIPLQAITSVDFQNKVRNLPHPQEGTDTHLGLLEALNQFIINGRDKAIQIVLLITDGKSRNRVKTVSAADALRLKNVLIQAIAVGCSVDIDELEAVTGTELRVYQVTNYGLLKRLIINIHEFLCFPDDTKSTTRSTGTTTNVTETPPSPPVGEESTTAPTLTQTTPTTTTTTPTTTTTTPTTTTTTPTTTSTTPTTTTTTPTTTTTTPTTTTTTPTTTTTTPTTTTTTPTTTTTTPTNTNTATKITTPTTTTTTPTTTTTTPTTTTTTPTTTTTTPTTTTTTPTTTTTTPTTTTTTPTTTTTTPTTTTTTPTTTTTTPTTTTTTPTTTTTTPTTTTTTTPTTTTTTPTTTTTTPTTTTTTPTTTTTTSTTTTTTPTTTTTTPTTTTTTPTTTSTTPISTNTATKTTKSTTTTTTPSTTTTTPTTTTTTPTTTTTTPTTTTTTTPTTTTTTPTTTTTTPTTTSTTPIYTNTATKTTKSTSTTTTPTTTTTTPTTTTTTPTTTTTTPTTTTTTPTTTTTTPTTTTTTPTTTTTTPTTTTTTPTTTTTTPTTTTTTPTTTTTTPTTTSITPISTNTATKSTKSTPTTTTTTPTTTTTTTPTTTTTTPTTTTTTTPTTTTTTPTTTTPTTTTTTPTTTTTTPTPTTTPTTTTTTPTTTTTTPTTTTTTPTTTTTTPTTTTTTPTISKTTKKKMSTTTNDQVNESTSPPVTENPSHMCDGCIRYLLFGYKGYPGLCYKYVICYFNSNDDLTGIQIFQCSHGQFWNPDKLTCDRPGAVNCLDDVCKSRLVTQYPHLENCRLYWLCKGGKTSEAMCCPTGYKATVTGCVSDPKCDDPCGDPTPKPGTTIKPPCTTSPVPGSITQYYETISGGSRIRRDCPPGTSYVHADCLCSGRVSVPEDKCLPDMYLPFDKNIRDNSKNKYSVRSLGRTKIKAIAGMVGAGAAYFNGINWLMVWRYINADMQHPLVIKVRILETGGGDTSNGKKLTVVSNNDCGSEPSIDIATTPTSITSSIHTVDSALKRTTVHNISTKVWRDVTYVYNGTHLWVHTKYSGITKITSTVVNGNVRRTQCAFKIGHGKTVDERSNFVGYIDEVYVYLGCIPDGVKALMKGR